MSKKKQRKGVSPINYSDIPDLVTVEWFAKLMSIDKRTEQWSNFLKYGSSIVPMASDSMVQMSEIPHDTKSARKSFRKSFAKSVDYRDVKTISKCIGLNVTETRELLDGIDDAYFVVNGKGERLYSMLFVDDLEYNDMFVDALNRHDERLAANRKKKHDSQLAALDAAAHGDDVRMNSVPQSVFLEHYGLEPCDEWKELLKHGDIDLVRSQVPVSEAAKWTKEMLEAKLREYHSDVPKDPKERIAYCMEHAALGEDVPVKYITQSNFMEFFGIEYSHEWRRFFGDGNLRTDDNNKIDITELHDWTKQKLRDAIATYRCLNLKESAAYIGLSTGVTKRLIDENGIEAYDWYQLRSYKNYVYLYRIIDLDALMETDAYKKSANRSAKSKAKKTENASKIETEKQRIRDAITVSVRTREHPLEHAVIFDGPTNSGKTHRALERLAEDYEANRDGVYVYAGPLRMLAREVYDKMRGVYGDDVCGYWTGEEFINKDARIICCTPEMAPMTGDSIVLDETHWMVERDRGSHWTTLLIGGAYRNFYAICATEATKPISQLLDNASHLDIEKCERYTPITYCGDISYRSLHKQTGVVTFSEKACYAICGAINRVGKVKAGVLYGAMPLPVRDRQIKRFTDGELDVLVTTDVIGHGVNIPFESIVFAETQKFDGIERRNLKIWEAAQIAGRAGRYGMHSCGCVYTLGGMPWFTCNAKLVSKATQAAAGKARTDLKIDGASVTPHLSDLACDDPNKLRFCLMAWADKVKQQKFPLPIKPSEMPQRLEILDHAADYNRAKVFPNAMKSGKWKMDVETLWKLSGAPLDPNDDAFYAIMRMLQAGSDDSDKNALLDVYKRIASEVRYFASGIENNAYDDCDDCVKALESCHKTLMQCRTIGVTFGTLGQLSFDALDELINQCDDVLAEYASHAERMTYIGVCQSCGKPCAPWFFECDRCHRERIERRRMFGYDDWY